MDLSGCLYSVQTSEKMQKIGCAVHITTLCRQKPSDLTNSISFTLTGKSVALTLPTAALQVVQDVGNKVREAGSITVILRSETFCRPYSKSNPNLYLF